MSKMDSVRSPLRVPLEPSPSHSRDENYQDTGWWSRLDDNSLEITKIGKDLGDFNRSLNKKFWSIKDQALINLGEVGSPSSQHNLSNLSQISDSPFNPVADQAPSYPQELKSRKELFESENDEIKPMHLHFTEEISICDSGIESHYQISETSELHSVDSGTRSRAESALPEDHFETGPVAFLQTFSGARERNSGSTVGRNTSPAGIEVCTQTPEASWRDVATSAHPSLSTNIDSVAHHIHSAQTEPESRIHPENQLLNAVSGATPSATADPKTQVQLSVEAPKSDSNSANDAAISEEEDMFRNHKGLGTSSPIRTGHRKTYRRAFSLSFGRSKNRNGTNKKLGKSQQMFRNNSYDTVTQSPHSESDEIESVHGCDLIDSFKAENPGRVLEWKRENGSIIPRPPAISIEAITESDEYREGSDEGPGIMENTVPHHTSLGKI